MILLNVYDHVDKHQDLKAMWQTRLSKWNGRKKPLFFYCYSAYLDDRPAAHTVVIIALMEGLNHISPLDFECMVWYNDSNAITQEISPALYFYVSYELHNDHGRDTYTIHCPTRLKSRPLFGGIRATFFQNKRHSKLCSVPVVTPEKPKYKQDLGLCGPPIYHDETCKKCKPYNVSEQLIPWLEMQKILGIKSVTIYNHSMTSDTSKILEHYSKSGYVKVHEQRAIPGEVHRVPNSVAINDCLYRNMHAFEKIIAIDVDELIIPRQNTTLMQLVKNVARSFNIPFYGTQFWFANTLFYNDYMSNNTRGMQMLKSIYRTAPEGFPGGCKSIIDPQTCMHAFAHMCKFDISRRIIRVNSSIAALHHYKSCSDSWWRDRDTTCQETFTSMVRDTIMLDHYEEELVKRVESVRKEMQGMIVMKND